MNPNVRVALKLVNRFEEAARAYEIRGSQRPIDMELIEIEFAAARAALLDYITRNVKCDP